VNTSMRLLMSCGSEDIYCSASERSLNIQSNEFQSPPLNLENEALRTSKSAKESESNSHMHQLDSSKDKSDFALEEEGSSSKEFQSLPLDIADEALRASNHTKRQESDRQMHQLNSSKYKSDFVLEEEEETPAKEFQSLPLDIADEALRASNHTKRQESDRQMHQLNSSKYTSDFALEEEEETDVISHATKRESNEVEDTSLNIGTPPRRRLERRCSVTKFNLEDNSDSEEESERTEKSSRKLLTHPRGVEQTIARPLLEPLSRLASSGRARPSLQRMWVSVTNIQVPPIQESMKDSQDESNTCEEDQCPLILGRAPASGEKPELRTKFFQFSQLKTRSLRLSRPQLRPSWSSSRYLRVEETKHSEESQTSEEETSPSLLTKPRGNESSVPEETERPLQATNPKRNWPSLGLRGLPSVIKATLDDEDGVHDDKVSKEFAEKPESHNDASDQPILRSRGNRPKLQRRNSITKFNLDNAANESFRRRRPRLERRCSVTQFSLGVKEAQAETTSNCVLVAPKMPRPKLSRSGQATVLIFSKESLDLVTDELKHNAIAPTAA
jgi:hypothetical protein